MVESKTAIMGNEVVRSAMLKTSGTVEGEFRPAADSEAILRGTCNPEIFANFGVEFEDAEIGTARVTLMTKDSIQPGQTGSVALRWLDVEFIDDEGETRSFKGPGTLELSVHEAAPDSRRMTGSMTATNLKRTPTPFDDQNLELSGELTDVEFAFDMNFSCGTI